MTGVKIFTGSRIRGRIKSLDTLNLAKLKIQGGAFRTPPNLGAAPACWRGIGLPETGSNRIASGFAGAVRSGGPDAGAPLPAVRSNGGKYVVVVDGYSTGRLLAPQLRREGHRPIHIKSSPINYKRFMDTFRPDDYERLYVHEGNLDDTASILGQFSPAAVIVGGEKGVKFGDQLSESLGLFTNGTELTEARIDKYAMWERLNERGVPVGKQTKVTDVEAALSWIGINLNYPVVLKPTKSSGSDGVFICHGESDVRRAFNAIFGRVNKSNVVNDSVVVQEYMSGTEYAVDTVSFEGKHIVTDIWEYVRDETGYGQTVYISDKLLPYEGNVQGKLISYAVHVLDALGIKYGPAHTEIRMTGNGPRFIEIGARFPGGDYPILTQEAIGFNQIDLAIAAYLSPDAFAVFKPGYSLMKHAMMVSLPSDSEGGIMSYEVVPRLEELPGMFRYKMYHEEGSPVPRTVNSDTLIGEIWLVHEREDVVEESAATIRGWNSERRFVR